MNDINGSLTTTTSNCYQVWPYLPTVPDYNFSGYVRVIEEPTTCIGKAHVFECVHVEKCQCGSIQRVMPKMKAKK